MIVYQNAGRRAVLRGRIWQCPDKAWEATLNQDTQLIDVPTADPFPEQTVATALLALYGGAITQAIPPETEPDRIH